MEQNDDTVEEKDNEDEKWEQINIDFSRKYNPIHVKLLKEEAKPADVAAQFNEMLADLLKSNSIVKNKIKKYFKHKAESTTTIDEAKELKNKLKKKAQAPYANKEDKSNACEALRYYNLLLKKKNEKQETKEIKEQEKSYKKNFHKFAKETTKGTYNKPPVVPTFSKEEANQHYLSKYSTEVKIDLDQLSWFPDVLPPSTPYDLSPYTAEEITKALAKKNQVSAPGDDELLYEFLSKMPSTHEFLATLFTRIRDSSEGPEIWASSKVILITKDEDTNPSDPTEFRMISLTANVGKLYHTLESSRTIQFMITNKYLDPSAQKAYINGVNGCVEHIQVVQEVIQHAKTNNKTAHITWIDLIDAFGSLPHMLIPYVFRHYHIPSKIINYITNMYSKLKGRVTTKEWETEVFRFLSGAFQGDSFSGIIFLISLNPLIEYIKQFKSKQGYEIEEKDGLETTDNAEESDKKKTTNIITTPFADDFNLISKNKKLHQKLLLDVQNKAKSMGFLFKPRKCRTLSICAGQSQNVKFVIKDFKNSNINIDIETMHMRPHKFLGSQITHTNSSHDYFQHFHKILKEKMTNIDTSKVRGEHKLAIYERYALPSMRFHLSVHDLNKTHLDELDKLTSTFLKKWLKFPTRGVTNVSIFHPYLLNVKQPSQLYHEGHTGNLALMTIKGDSTVNACIRSKIQRESKWKRKVSTTVKSQKLIARLVENGTIQKTKQKDISLKTTIKQAKVAIKKEIKAEILDKWNSKVRQLTMQGEFAELLIEEKESVTWQSIVRNVPRNTMAFAARLTTNTLATPDNLVRWGKRKIGICPLCNSPNGTLAHMTNICTVACNQGRFTWRHDSVLHYFTSVLKHLATEDTEIFADLTKHKTNGTTIPADILVSSGEGSRPDLVLINRTKKTILLMELTCSLPRNSQKSHQKKLLKYTDLEITLTECGYSVILLPFEVGSNGHITRENRNNIQRDLKKFKIKLKSHIFKNMSKISLLCTMSIFYAYQTKEWTSPPYLTP